MKEYKILPSGERLKVIDIITNTFLFAGSLADCVEFIKLKKGLYDYIDFVY